MIKLRDLFFGRRYRKLIDKSFPLVDSKEQLALIFQRLDEMMLDSKQDDSSDSMPDTVTTEDKQENQTI